MSKFDVTLIGAGNMAQAYANVLHAQKISFNVVGRGEKSAKNFAQETGVTPTTGGLNAFLDNHLDQLAQIAIVALPVAGLAEACIQLIKAGTKRILVEKPAGLNLHEINEIAALSADRDCQVYVALNRRFLSSVSETAKRVSDDGGVTSFTFEFTEWANVIEKTSHPQIVKENWFLANSLHVIDLAFYLGGRPKQLYSQNSGQLDWHPRASRFVGAGTASNGALFSYHADWGAPGRWGVEILTRHHRYILRPLEQLQIQKLNSVEIKTAKIDDSLDTKFKPGLYKMVKHFISDQSTFLLPTISEHAQNTQDLYTVMLPESSDECAVPRVVGNIRDTEASL